MTSICPGSGPSAAKSWVSPLFLVPAGAAANYIGNAGGVWASVLAAVIGAKTYDAATHCSTDPPGWPAAFTANEMLDLTLNILGTADWISGAAKVNQILDASPAGIPASAGRPADTRSRDADAELPTLRHGHTTPDRCGLARRNVPGRRGSLPGATPQSRRTVHTGVLWWVQHGGLRDALATPDVCPDDR
jgi:hypothetical protein